MKIGFIGLGRMGAAMAANLVRAGHEVTVFNRSPGKSAALVELAARAATQLAEACTGDAVLALSLRRQSRETQRQFLLASVIETLGEAVALIAKAGIDPHAYIEFLTSTVFNVPAYKTYGALIAQGKFEPAGFAAPLGYKDIRLTLAAAESLRVPMPVGSLLHDRFLRVLAHGGDSLDWAAIGGLASQDAGRVQPRERRA